MPSKKFPIDIAQLVGLFMESIFYGMYLMTFFTCLWALVAPAKSWRNVNVKMLIPAILMFIFASMDLIFGLMSNIDAFIKSSCHPIETFGRTSYWLSVMKMVCYIAQTCIGDVILLYRCWVIWNKKWYVIVVPFLIWVAGIACGVMLVYREATLSQQMSLLNNNRLSPFIASVLSLTFAENLLTSSLIVYRIWSIQRSIKFRATIVSEKGPLSKAVRILIESGLMYTTSVVILFVLHQTGNNAQYGVSDSIVQIIGIAFNLIIIRVHRGNATKPMSDTQPTASVTHNNSLSITDPPESKSSEWK